MRCPRCDTSNPTQAKFCQECGTPLAGGCSNCGSPLPTGAKFCPECGTPVSAAPEPARTPRSYTPKHLAERILTTRSALIGERKQVTVLFADMKGSLAFSEQVDPEEWHRILDRFFAILSEGIHRFEGTINQFTGDGIMALFGAPIAHEDHAHRACYAALQLRDELRRYSEELKRSRGLTLPVRMGINSGEVIVGSIGDDLRMDYTAQGHTVGLAARLEQLADPGTVYVSGSTAALVSGYFRLRDLGRFEIKGNSQPTTVHELTDVGTISTRLQLSQARGFSRFVGRSDEMELLETALEQATQGKGQAIGIVGDAGIGKSRLCFEFLERCRARGIEVHEAHGVPYGNAVPFVPVLTLFRSYLGIQDEDSPAEARRKIAGTLLVLDEGLRPCLPIVYDFLGVSDPANPSPEIDPEKRQQRLFEILKRVSCPDRDDPAVTLIEDLHWVDPASASFLVPLAETVKERRELLVLNYRPSFQHKGMPKIPFREIRLLPLGNEAIDELLKDLLGTDPEVQTLAERIRERAAGYPFYVEEVVRSLVEAGALEGARGSYRLTQPVGAIAIPTTVQSILAARIDRLGEREKEVLQTAAVIGKEFSQKLLGTVVGLSNERLDGALAKLETAEFVYLERPYPTPTYAFAHPLTQEVAYRTQLQDRRAELHGEVARAIEGACCAEKLEEQSALLAHHWEEAGDALNAGRWRIQAGKWAVRSDIQESLRHYRKALELLGSIPDSPESRGYKLTAQAGILQTATFAPVGEEEAARTFEEGKALALKAKDTRGLAMLLTAYGNAQASAGDADSALAHAKEAMHLARETGDAEFELSLRATIMFAYYAAGRLNEAMEYVAESNRRLFGKEVISFDETGTENFVGRAFRAMVISYMGKFEEARREMERAIRSAQEQGQSYSWMRGNMVEIAFFSGNYEGAMNHGRAAVEIAEGYGSPFFSAVAYRALGLAHVLLEEWELARSVLARALALIRSSRTALHLEASILALLAPAQLHLGEAEEALQTARDAVDSAHKSHARLGECNARLALARILIHTDGREDADTVEEQLQGVEALIGETGATSYAPFLHLWRSDLAEALGDEARRRSELEAARAAFAKLGASGHVARIEAELAA